MMAEEILGRDIISVPILIRAASAPTRAHILHTAATIPTPDATNNAAQIIIVIIFAISSAVIFSTCF